MLANTDVRETAKKKDVRLWEIAEYLNVSDPTMTRKLRRELPDNEKQRILAIIDEIAAAKQKMNTAVQRREGRMMKESNKTKSAAQSAGTL